MILDDPFPCFLNIGDDANKSSEPDTNNESSDKMLYLPD